MKKLEKFLYWIVGIIIVFAILGAIAPERKARPQKQLTEQQIAEQKLKEKMKKIKRQFSAWDGAHIKLQNLIKMNMADPGSYEHMQTIWRQKNGYLIVTTRFRGKNAFGGYVVNTIKAKVDLDGNVLKVY